MNRFISQLDKSKQNLIKKRVEEELKKLDSGNNDFYNKENINNAMNSRVQDLTDLIPRKELEKIIKK